MFRITSDGLALITLHIFTIVPSLGLTRPRSIRLTVVRSQSASNPTLSWDTFTFFLIFRNAWPKAFSGPERG